jgi:processive 1,2-diacylglycerol beta-glucosyltransferase
VDKYYVATDDLSEQLRSLGVASERIQATGIPTRPSLSAIEVRASAAYSYGLVPNKPIVLVMAAANATLAETEELCRKLTERCKVQVAIVCGHNRMLKGTLTEYFQNNSNVSVLGYVDRMDELMAISACIITKPGGLTLSEAINSLLPIFLYRPVPGQERNNARYLESKGAAFIGYTGEQLIAAVDEVLNNSGRLAEVQQALQALRKNGASDSIALDIVHQLNIMEEASSVLIP